MVNSKKMNKSAVAVIVLALLLVLSLVLTATGAWFTESVPGSQVDKNFGEVTMTVKADSFGKVSRASNETSDNVTGKVMPGDTINYALTVQKGAQSENFWYVVILTVTVDGTAKVTEPAASDVKNTAADGWTGAEGGSLTLNGADYGNTFETKAIVLNYEVRAIQMANIADQAAAFAELVTNWA